MAVIENVSVYAVDYQQTIQAVADIEAVVQPHDAWTYQILITLLEQDSIDMLIVYEKEKKERVLDNKVVGYCLYQVVFEQAEILRIGTHPNYQRQGIASQLFDKLNRELMQRQVENLLLEVRADNILAIALYEQQQFVVIHRRKSYYQLKDKAAIDALIMQRVYT
ncbi:MAG: ribosomal protein S18-alanine N-acetyltransferase [Psychrobacter alimentarius]